MLYEIKVLKAPWPQGAKVGDVVDMPYLPVWAQGKCVTAADGAEESIEFEEPVPADGVGRPLLPGQGDADAQILVVNAELADLRAKLAAADDEVVRLLDLLQAASGAQEGAAQERDTAVAEATDLRAKLAAAEQAAAANTGGKGKAK